MDSSFKYQFNFITGLTKLLLGQRELFKKFELEALSKLNNFMELMGTCESSKFLPLLEECFNFYLCCMDESQFLIDGIINCDNQRAKLPTEFVIMNRLNPFLRNDRYHTDTEEELFCLYVACMDGFDEFLTKINRIKRKDKKQFSHECEELEMFEICVDDFRFAINDFQRSLYLCFRDAEGLAVKGDNIQIYTYNGGSLVRNSRQEAIVQFIGRPSWNYDNSLWHSMSYAQRLELKNTLRD